MMVATEEKLAGVVMAPADVKEAKRREEVLLIVGSPRRQSLKQLKLRLDDNAALVAVVVRAKGRENPLERLDRLTRKSTEVTDSLDANFIGAAILAAATRERVSTAINRNALASSSC
jgi:phosphoribosylcarboxyaminoimidazole (NCAIR) mutase